MAAGDRVSFKLITIEEAERESCELERSFAFLRFGVRNRSAGVL